MRLQLPSINKEHRGDVQVLRAVAVTLVILYHLKIVKGGFLGVDIFFVISGYVITLNLMKSQGSLSEKLSNFYLRRAKRILPASLVVVAITALATKLLLAPIYQNRFRIDALWSSLMGANIGFGLHGLDYLQATTSPSPFLHFWSLGVEEQFYIIWPILFFLFIGNRKRIFALLLPFTIAVALVSTALFPVFSFYLPTSRAFQFLFGAGVAIAGKYQRNNYLALVGWIGILGAALLTPDGLANPNRFSLIPTVCTAFVILADSNILNIKPLIYLGELSFTLYLVHWPIILLLGNGAQSIHGLKIALAILIMAVATLLLSTIIEIPFRYERLGKISPRNWILILTTVTLIAQSVYLIPTNTKNSNLAFDLSKPAVYTNGCHLNQRQSKLNSECKFGNVGPKVLLVGDSHAAQWFPALQQLANRNLLVLISQTKSSCPMTLDSVISSGQIDKSCDAWHKNILKLIYSTNFDYVVLANFDHFGYKYSAAATGIDAFVELIKTKTKVVQVLDTPTPPSDSVGCLSSNLSRPSRCDFKTKPSRTIAGIGHIDPTPWLCNMGRCFATLNGYNTYRDGSHISVTTARNLADNFYLSLLKNNRS